MKPVEISLAAQAETDEAARYYERHRPGLGDLFLNAVQETWDRLQPVEQHAVTARVAGLVVRQAHVGRRFPYRVIFVDDVDRVHVVAVAHTARRPFYWRGRI